MSKHNYKSKKKSSKEKPKKLNSYVEVYKFTSELYGGKGIFEKGSRSEEDLKIIEFRLKNIDLFRDALLSYNKSILGFDIEKTFGIDSSFSINNIPEIFDGPDKDDQCFPMGYSDEFREELMACTKYKIFEAKKFRMLPQYVKGKAREDSKFHVFETYYSGIVQGQVVLFKEEVMYPTKKNPILGSEEELDESNVWYTQNAGDYEFKAIIRGLPHGVLEICRYDHNRQHGNVFDKNGIIDKNNIQINTSHLHYNDLKYTVVYPWNSQSADAFEVDSNGLSFPLCVRAIRNALNIPFMQNMFDINKDANKSIDKITRYCEKMFDPMPLQERMIDRFQSELYRFMVLQQDNIIELNHKGTMKGEKEINEILHKNGYDFDSYDFVFYDNIFKTQEEVLCE